MKRKSVVLITSLSIFVIVLIANFYSRKYAVLHSDPVDAIPPDAAFFIEVKNGMDGAALLLKTSFFNSLAGDSAFNILKKNIGWLDSALQTIDIAGEIRKKQIVYISAHPTKADEFDFLFLTNIPRGESERAIASIIKEIAGDGFEENIREYEDVKLHELIRNDRIEFTYSVSRGIVMISRTSFLVEDAIRQLKSGNSLKKAKSFTRINKRISGNEYAALFMNSYAMHDMLSAYIDPSNEGIQNSITNFLRWSRLSVTLEAQGIQLSGTSIAADTNDFIAAFRGHKPEESRIATYIPGRTALVASFTSDHLDQMLMRLRVNLEFFIDNENREEIIDSISKKYKTELRKSMAWPAGEFALVITEPASYSLENNLYAFVKSNKTPDALFQLQKLQMASKGKPIEKYLSHSIGNIQIPALVPMCFGNRLIDVQKC